MFTVAAGVRAAILSDLQYPVARLVALASDRKTVRASFESTQARALAGSVRYDRTMEVRRTGTATISNHDGALSPKVPGDLFYAGSIFRMDAGWVAGGARIYIPLATLVVTPYAADMRGTLVIAGNSPLFLCQGQMGAVLSLPAGMAGELAIRALLEPVLGDGSTWSLNAGGRALSAPRQVAETDDRLQTAIAVAQDLGCELFDDRWGNPVLQPVPDPTKLTAVRNLQVAPGVAVMTTLQRTGSALPYNRQITYGDNPAFPGVRGQADVTDTSSPIHSSKIGLRTAPAYRSAQITTQDQGNLVAYNLLVSQAYYQDSLSVGFVPDQTIDEGDVIAAVETVSGTNGTYWVQSVEHPWLMGESRIVGPKVLGIQA